MSGADKKAEEIGKRPEPGELDLKWIYLNWTKSYYFDMWRSDGLDTLNFTDPRMDPQPRELEGGSLDMILTRQRMIELRDTLTYLIDNWGKPWAHESHPELK